MDVVDDVDLLNLARRGDGDAFTTLFARHQRAIFRYATHMCGRDAADDVVQETFLAVLRQAGRYDSSRGSVVAYLFGIARHSALKRIAHAIDAGGEVDEHWTDPAAGVGALLDDLSRAEVVAAVRRAVEALPTIYREAIVLCELEEMDYAAAAAILQCPIGTVRSRLHRAKALLAAKLTEAAVVQEIRS